MLLYQFVLTIGGFLWRAAWSREVERRPSPPAEWPGVSILVPARNEEKVIDGLLDHLQRLDYPRDRLEIIVINDGSTDRTAGLVRLRPERRCPQLAAARASRQGEGGRGKSAVLNRGLAVAAHPLIAIYDADNRPEPGSLKTLCRRAGRRIRRLAAVTGKFRAYNKDRTLADPARSTSSRSPSSGSSRPAAGSFSGWPFFPAPTIVIRKDVLEKIGGWDENALAEDSELTFRIYDAGYLVKFIADRGHLGAGAGNAQSLGPAKDALGPGQ